MYQSFCQLQEQGLVPEPIRQIWHQVQARREKNGFKPVIDLLWDFDKYEFVLVYADNSGKSYDSPDKLTQALRATLPEAAELHQFFADPAGYTALLAERQVERHAHDRLKALVASARFTLSPPDATPDDWRAKYQVPRWDWTQTLPTSLQLHLSCMDNCHEVGAYARPSNRLATLESPDGQTLARCILYAQSNGTFVHAPIYTVKVGDYLHSYNYQLEERLRQELAQHLDVRPIDTRLEYLDPPPQLALLPPTYGLPFLDDPHRPIHVLGLRCDRDQTNTLHICPLEQAEFLQSPSHRLLPMTREHRDLLQKLLQVRGHNSVLLLHFANGLAHQLQALQPHYTPLQIAKKDLIPISVAELER
ncbi:MAG: hypothetical protein NZ482_01920 [Gloeomargarita sp. SKYG98]|nr:hypothetical protein [Gloeomargarita sp. SKYG98]